MDIKSLRVLCVVLVMLVGLNLIQVIPGDDKATSNLPLSDTVVLLAGDSRSSTDYTFYGELLESKSGCSVLIEGASGMTAAYNASNEYFERLAVHPHDFSIWLVGGNDNGARGTIGTFSNSSELALLGEPIVKETDLGQDYNGETFIQAIDHIMRKYKAMYYDFRELTDGCIPTMVFCTDLPQKRESEGTAWSDPRNWERKRLAILECCEKNNVICLDLLRQCHFDMSYEPYFEPPTDKERNYGVYYMDGLHPNVYGMDIITNLEINLLTSYKRSLFSST